VGSGTARLLYVLAGIAIEEKDWPGALAMAKRMVAEFAAEEPTDDALARVGTTAAAAGAWPAAWEALATLHARYPKSPLVEGSRLLLAETQLETGRAAEARPALERLVTAAPSDPRATDTWIALARAREATGDRQGALEAYARAARDGGTTGWKREALLTHGRLLTEERRWSEARTVFEGVLKQDSGGGVAEAAAGIGDTYRGEGESLAAVEYYMTAAYLAPESPAGRRALAAAARSFAAMKQPAAAAIVWKKLLAQSGLPADLAAAAREGLKEIGR
jgi:tetratricopeptide (TPR) repeat protein